jgi:hypothetical protein
VVLEIEGRTVIVTHEDYEYINELYKKLNHQYKVQDRLARVDSTSHENDMCLKFGQTISFLIEHSAFGDKEIRAFAAKFVIKKRIGKQQL